MRAHSLLATLLILIQLPLNAALAADTPAATDNTANCATLTANPPDGTSTDRFMREWCQRKAPAATTAHGTATPPPPQSPTVTSPAPIPTTPTYSTDDSADQLNSSRLPPGYHCHMLKFGERICHGGLD